MASAEMAWINIIQTRPAPPNPKTVQARAEKDVKERFLGKDQGWFWVNRRAADANKVEKEPNTGLSEATMKPPLVPEAASRRSFGHSLPTSPSAAGGPSAAAAAAAANFSRRTSQATVISDSSWQEVLGEPAGSVEDYSDMDDEDLVALAPRSSLTVVPIQPGSKHVPRSSFSSQARGPESTPGAPPACIPEPEPSLLATAPETVTMSKDGADVAVEGDWLRTGSEVRFRRASSRTALADEDVRGELVNSLTSSCMEGMTRARPRSRSPRRHSDSTGDASAESSASPHALTTPGRGSRMLCVQSDADLLWTFLAGMLLYVASV